MIKQKFELIKRALQVNYIKLELIEQVFFGKEFDPNARI